MMIFFLSCLGNDLDIQVQEEQSCFPLHAPLRRLNALQYHASIDELLSVDIPAHIIPQTTKGADFRSWASSNPLSPSTIESMMTAAEYAANHTDIEQESECVLNDAPCLQNWILSIGAQAYRRPLLSSENEQLQLFFSSGLSAEEATKITLMLILQHPAFLYYDGLKATTTATMASSYEIATRLSFFLRNAPPDQELIEYAQQDALRSREQVHMQAMRLAQSAQTFETLNSFHYDWLNLYLLDALFKDPVEYPDFGAHTISAMKEETELFVTETLWMNEPTFETLLLSNRAWLHPDLSATYDTELDDDWNVYMLPEERPGILTRSAFLSAHASSASSSPVRRGAFVLQELLCEELSPPPEVDMEIPPPTTELPTIRERLAAHSVDPSCRGCHIRIDPVGYAFEHFDAMGEWRANWEGGQPVDASGSLDGNDFHDVTELVGWLSTSERAQRCYAKKWMEYALGRPLDDADTCTLQQIQDRFVDSGGNIQQLLIDISTSDSFLYLPLEQP